MQRLTGVFEAHRYGHWMTNPRLSVSTSSPAPMIPKAASQSAAAPATMRSCVIDDVSPAGGSDVQVAHVIVV